MSPQSIVALKKGAVGFSLKHLNQQRSVINMLNYFN